MGLNPSFEGGFLSSPSVFVVSWLVLPAFSTVFVIVSFLSFSVLSFFPFFLSSFLFSFPFLFSTSFNSSFFFASCFFFSSSFFFLLSILFFSSFFVLSSFFFLSVFFLSSFLDFSLPARKMAFSSLEPDSLLVASEKKML